MDYYILRGAKNHPNISVVNNGQPAKRYLMANWGEMLPATPPDEGTFDLVLYNKSVVTDVVRDFADSFSSGLFVSSKLRQVLDTFQLPLHTYFAGSLTQRGHKYPNYQHLFLPNLSDKQSIVDCRQTEFYTIIGESDYCGGPARFDTHMQASKGGAALSLYESVNNGSVSPRSQRRDAKLYLGEAAYQYDIINLPYMSIYGYYISTPLRDALVQAEITGIELGEAPWVRRAD